MKRVGYVFGFALLATIVASAQINGAPASALSYGRGPNHAPQFGPPASAGSVGPRGWAPNAPLRSMGPVVTNHPVRPFPPGQNCRGSFNCFGHRPSTVIYAVPYYPSYYPYGGYYPLDTAAYDPQPQPTPDYAYYDNAPSNANVQANAYDAGYSAGLKAQQEIRNTENAKARDDDPDNSVSVTNGSSGSTRKPADKTPDLAPDTVLVFKDGHQVEIHNYAIIGQTLWNIGERTAHKINLADLDLDATRKANDDRGVPFSLPAARK